MFPFPKNFILILFVNVCLYVCMYVRTYVYLHVCFCTMGLQCQQRPESGHQTPLKPEPQSVLSYHLVLGAEPGPLEEQQMLLATHHLQDAFSRLSIPGRCFLTLVLNICLSAQSKILFKQVFCCLTVTVPFLNLAHVFMLRYLLSFLGLYSVLRIIS